MLGGSDSRWNALTLIIQSSLIFRAAELQCSSISLPLRFHVALIQLWPLWFENDPSRSTMTKMPWTLNALTPKRPNIIACLFFPFFHSFFSSHYVHCKHKCYANLIHSWKQDCHHVSRLTCILKVYFLFFYWDCFVPKMQYKIHFLKSFMNLSFFSSYNSVIPPIIES